MYSYTHHYVSITIWSYVYLWFVYFFFVVCSSLLFMMNAIAPLSVNGICQNNGHVKKLGENEIKTVVSNLSPVSHSTLPA